MEALLEPLVNSPKLPQYFHQLQDVLTEETARRARFYEEIDDGQKPLGE